jgi:hypothetical protein
MITTQTFQYEGNEDERATLAEALRLLAEKRYAEATAVLIARHDKVCAAPTLKLYDQREERI